MLVVILTLDLCSIVLNVGFLLAVWFRSKFHIGTKLFLCNLAVTNLGISVFCFNWDLTQGLQLYSSPWLCLVQFCVVPTALYVTLGTVLAIGIERIIAIRKPPNHKLYFTAKKVRIQLLCIWCAGILLTATIFPDFLAYRSLEFCSVLDLYPRRYGIAAFGFYIVIYLLLICTVTIVLVINIIIFSKVSRNIGSTAARTMDWKARKMTRIAICSALSYLCTSCSIVALTMILGLTNWDIMYIVQLDITPVADTMLIIFTFIDPLVFFVCSIDDVKTNCRRLLARFRCSCCRSHNRVAPAGSLTTDGTPSQQASSNSTSLAPVGSGPVQNLTPIAREGVSCTA